MKLTHLLALPLFIGVSVFSLACSPESSVESDQMEEGTMEEGAMEDEQMEEGAMEEPVQPEGEE